MILSPNDSNCKLYLPFSEGSGTTAKDYSSGSNDGTITGATYTKIQDGSYALDVNGSSDYVDINSTLGFTDGDSISFSCCVKIDAFNSLGVIISNYDRNAIKGTSLTTTSTYRNGIAIVSQNVSNYNWTNNNNALSLDTWYHVVATCVANGDVKLYIDSVEQTDTHNENNLTSSAFSARDFVLGAQAYYDGVGTERFFNGQIRLPMIWDRALTQAEVTELYNKTYIN